MDDPKRQVEEVSGAVSTTPPRMMSTRAVWSWIWIPGLFLWVAFSITADSIRVECTENAHCGVGNTCPDSTNACVCADHEVLLPRAYRCGANADLISNWADWVGLGTGVASLFSFIMVITLGKEEEEDHEDKETATFTDIALTLTSLGLIILGAFLWIASIFWVPAHVRMGMSISAIISCILALILFFYFPKSYADDDTTTHHTKKTDGGDAEAPRSYPRRSVRKSTGM